MRITRRPAIYISLAIAVGGAAIVFAQDRQALIERLSAAFSDAFNAYDPDRQVRPAALEILNANEALSEAFRSSLNENYESVPDALDTAEGALQKAGRILIDVSGQEVFRTDASRLQSELFFIVRDSRPETASDALLELGNASLVNASAISNLLVGEGEVDVLRSVLADVSSMRLVIASFYGLSDERR